MSKFQEIDRLLDDYLTKYGAKIPDFDEEMLLEVQQPNLSPSIPIEHISHVSPVNNGYELKQSPYLPETNQNTQYHKQKDLNLNKIQQALLDSHSITTMQSEQSQTSNSNLQVKLYSEIMNQVPKKAKSSQKSVDAIKTLLAERLRAKGLINAQKQQDAAKVHNEAYQKDWMTCGKVSIREIMAMQREINQLKTLIGSKNAVIREFRNENEKLKRQVEKKSSSANKTGILHRELNAAMEQISYLKKENQRLQMLLHQFVK